MKLPMVRVLLGATCALFTLIATEHMSAQDISSTPSSLRFSNTYVGKTSGSKVLTITKLASQTVTITSASFSCPGYGLASGVIPFTLTSGQTITHYSIFFQPTAAQ